MLTLPLEWIEYLVRQPETGMSYQVVTVFLRRGECFEQAIVIDGKITQVRGYGEIPFAADQIENIVVTHDKWNWSRP